MPDDIDLLRRYAEHREESAFAELVRRNLPLVYSAALRRLNGDTHRAQDIAQVVFCSLARDARKITRHPVLTGWLYTATRNAVIDVVRAENRRRAREQEAHTMHAIEAQGDAPADWSQLRPMLDAAMDQLRDDDRAAVLLRFFQGRSFAEVGTSLGLNEDSARKRVDRALDKLRDKLQRQGLVSTSAALATLLGSQAIAAVPSGLAATITGAALAAGAATTVGVGTFFALTKVQVSLLAAAALGGTAGLITQQHRTAELREQRAAAQQQAVQVTAENQKLNARVSELAAQLAQTQSELAALRQAQAADPKPSPAPAATSATAARAQGAPAGLPALSPLPQTTEIARQKANLHRRFDAFIAARHFTPAQGEHFIELLIHQSIAWQDLQDAVEAKGLRGNAPGVESLRAKLYAPILRGLHDLLGEDGYAAYLTYERLSYFREVFLTSDLAPRFAKAGTPLTPEQTDGLVTIIAANDHPERTRATNIATTTRIDWPAVMIAAREILTPPQQALLQSYANQQSPIAK